MSQAHLSFAGAPVALSAAALTGGEAPCKRARVSGGRAQPFDAIARSHKDALTAFAIRLCRDRAEANDLVQDTFERALRRFEALAPETNVRAWLFTILQNGFIDRCRRKNVAPRFEPVDDEAVAAPAPESAGAPAWARITAEQLGAAIDSLDDDFRVVYRMHAIESRSYQEIAGALGIPQNTVGTRLARARRKLRDILARATGTEAEP
jgi:RNA polymerase sigma-70 factor (ECF subfamily)